MEIKEACIASLNVGLLAKGRETGRTAECNSGWETGGSLTDIMPWGQVRVTQRALFPMDLVGMQRLLDQAD